MALCAFAGLRLGEAAALQVADIDFLRRQMKVTRQVQRPGGTRVDVRAPKYGSERTVHLAAGLVEILAEHVAEHCPGDDPHQMANVLARDAWQARSPDVNRRLIYTVSGVV